MSTADVEIDTAVEVHSVALREHLEVQRRSFVADGPPSVAVRRNRGYTLKDDPLRGKVTWTFTSR